MRVARPVTLDPEQRQLLEQQSRARSLPARVVERARIVLRAATGQQDKQIAAALGITPEKSARCGLLRMRRCTTLFKAQFAIRTHPCLGG